MCVLVQHRSATFECSRAEAGCWRRACVCSCGRLRLPILSHARAMGLACSPCARWWCLSLLCGHQHGGKWGGGWHRGSTRLAECMPQGYVHKEEDRHSLRDGAGCLAETLCQCLIIKAQACSWLGLNFRSRACHTKLNRRPHLALAMCLARFSVNGFFPAHTPHPTPSMSHSCFIP